MYGAGEWRLAGSCRQVDPDLFFAESERGPTRTALIVAAKAVCEACPVMRVCREHGLRAQEPFGIWGGLTEAERASTLRRQRWN
ncbi:MAG: WhiB family transcriptional regulator, partial [Ornithinimicrobium sp.]